MADAEERKAAREAAKAERERVKAEREAERALKAEERERAKAEREGKKAPPAEAAAEHDAQQAVAAAVAVVEATHVSTAPRTLAKVQAQIHSTDCIRYPFVPPLCRSATPWLMRTSSYHLNNLVEL